MNIEKNFDNILYEKYLHGELPYNRLCLICNCTCYEMDKYLKIKNLKHRQYYLENYTQHNFFDSIDSELKAYLLGLYYADGSISKNRISFSFTEKDAELIQIIKDNICPFNKITHVKSSTSKITGYTNKPMYGITFKSEHMCETLNKYKMGHHKTYSIQDDLTFIPDTYMIDFIRGYFDGDGTVHISKGKKNHILKDGTKKQYDYINYNWSIISHTNEHLYIIKDFLYKNYKLHCNIIKESRGNFLIEINRKKDFYKMEELLYQNANFFLKRKREKFMAIPC